MRITLQKTKEGLELMIDGHDVTMSKVDESSNWDMIQKRLFTYIQTALEDNPEVLIMINTMTVKLPL